MMDPAAQNSSNDSASRRWLHRFAILTACATFPLVFVGGLVTTYDVGMAVTDWPTTEGYNMFTYPWLKDFHEAFGKFVEHGHRLLGAAVGALTMVLAAWLWLAERRGWLRWLGVAVLAAVAFQGVLGGLRVLMVSRVLAVVHGCFAQAFFSLMVCAAWFTSGGRNTLPVRAEVPDARRLQRLALMTTTLASVQLILGAVVRHLGFEWVLIPHLIVAFVIVVHVGLLAKRILIGHSQRPSLVWMVEILVLLLACQLMLGAGAWATSSGFGPFAQAVVTGSHVFFATSHVAAGSLMLATCVVLTLSCYRDLAPLDGQKVDRPPRNADVEARRRESMSTRPTVSVLEPRELWMVEGTV